MRSVIKGHLLVLTSAAGAGVNGHAGLEVSPAAASAKAATTTASPATVAAAKAATAVAAAKAAAAAATAKAAAAAKAAIAVTKAATAATAAEAAATAARARAGVGVGVDLEPATGDLGAVELLGGLVLGLGGLKLDKANALERAGLAVGGQADVLDLAVRAKGLDQGAADVVLGVVAVKALDKQGLSLALLEVGLACAFVRRIASCESRGTANARTRHAG